jgi:hypothetical protein
MTLLGTRHEVLVEKGARRGDMLQGRTPRLQDGHAPGRWCRYWRVLRGELTGTTGSTFTGHARRAEQPRRGALPMAAAPALPALV